MKWVKIYTVIGLAILGLCFSCDSSANSEKEEEAVGAAKAWLTLIDEGKYGESWETTAAYFKNAITQEKWEQMLIAVRKPLDQLISRELSSKKFMTSILRLTFPD